jgi:hypothetical protein
VAVRVASAAAIAPATGPPVGSMVGASAVAASAARVAIGDDLTIAASSCGAVASLRGSAGVCTSTVGLSRQLGSSTVTTEVHAATCGFVVAVPGGGRLSDPVVDSHEVSVYRELGDDLSRAHPLGLMCYRSDRHEALLWVVCTRLSTWWSASARLRMGRESRRRRHRSFRFLLRSR